MNSTIGLVFYVGQWYWYTFGVSGQSLIPSLDISFPQGREVPFRALAVRVAREERQVATLPNMPSGNTSEHAKWQHFRTCQEYLLGFETPVALIQNTEVEEIVIFGVWGQHHTLVRVT